MAQIKTFEAACKKLKLDPKKCLPGVSEMPQHHQEATIAHAKLVIITEALNEGWVPDWKSDSQYKYYPWFNMSSGSGLSYGVCVIRNSGSVVGSRLCFKSRQLAEYAAKQFLDIYTDFFIIN